MEFVALDLNRVESLILAVVRIDTVNLELYTNEFVSIMESDAFELLNSES